MPILKFNKSPSGDAEDRRAHVIGHGEGVSLQHSAFGDLVEGAGHAETTNPNVQLATKWSTAPYTGPPVEDVEERNEPPNPWGYRSPKRAKKCMANDDTCAAWATKASEYQYCYPHHRLNQGRPAWSPNEKPETE
jgi:hypothetical protein